MRVALDIRYRTGSGASVYTNSLLDSLLRQNTAYDFVVVKFMAQQSGCTAGYEAINVPDLGAATQVAWDQLVLPHILRTRRVDLYHPLKMLGCLGSPCPQIRVAHSITTPYRGEFPVGRAQTAYWLTLGHRLFRSSTKVIAVSNFMREFLIEALHIPDSRVVVIYNGVDSEFQPSDETEDSSTVLGVSPPYLLSVGNVVPVKNHVSAVLAFQKIAARFPQQKLVIAGGTGHGYFNDVSRAVERTGLASRVFFLGHVDKKRLAALYRHATLLVMPSLTEGFGLSALEAMSCGLPVIGSGRGALPEIGGGAIRIVENPRDVQQWSAAISDLLEHAELRAAMREASIRRAAGFTWDKAARQTLALYGQVLTSSH